MWQNQEKMWLSQKGEKLWPQELVQHPVDSSLDNFTGVTYHPLKRSRFQEGQISPDSHSAHDLYVQLEQSWDEDTAVPCLPQFMSSSTDLHCKPAGLCMTMLSSTISSLSGSVECRWCCKSHFVFPAGFQTPSFYSIFWHNSLFYSPAQPSFTPKKCPFSPPFPNRDILLTALAP